MILIFGNCLKNMNIKFQSSPQKLASVSSSNWTNDLRKRVLANEATNFLPFFAKNFSILKLSKKSIRLTGLLGAAHFCRRILFSLPFLLYTFRPCKNQFIREFWCRLVPSYIRVWILLEIVLEIELFLVNIGKFWWFSGF